ncbi:MAG: O-antigen ligase family protein [Ignavibacteriaceae bacterium]|nr:O-antigen ligase family protein [Ignavibacteriaceae bacterium]
MTLSEIKDFKYLFILELFLLSIFVAFDYVPVLIIFAILLIFPSFYFFYEKPILLLELLLFSILAGSVGTMKLGGKIPQILFVDMLFPVVLFFFVVKGINGSINSEGISKITLLFFAFLLWGLLSFFLDTDKLRVLLSWKSYFAGFVCFLFAYNVLETHGQLIRYLILLILWGIILSIIEFYITLELGGIRSGLVGLFLKKNLLATSWGRSNYLATFYVFILPIATGFFLIAKPFKLKIFAAISILFMVTGLILTLSRGGLLALGIAMLIFFARVMKLKTFIPIIIFLLLVTIILVINPLTNVLFAGLGAVEKSNSYFSRLNFYKDVWRMFLENPITGVGLGNLGLHAKFVVHNFASAHNIVLGLLGETGIVGAFLFVSVLIGTFLKSFKYYISAVNETNKIVLWAIISSTIGVLIHSFMEPNFEGFQFSMFFWTSIGVFFRAFKSEIQFNVLFKK